MKKWRNIKVVFTDKIVSRIFILFLLITINPLMAKEMSKSQEYAQQYAEAAMEQMRKYGIPASVTLAQGILESSNGQSELTRIGNNHFGVKATSEWIKAGGSYLVYADDKPNEKFCRYASAADSYEHHSLILRANSRYAELFKLSPSDYVGWTRGLQRAGYATDKAYAAKLLSVIKANNLDRYDRKVLGEEITQKQPEVKVEQSSGNLQNNQEKEPETPKNYFNTLLSTTNDEKDSWEKLFETENGYSTNPIVEIMSSLFAGLLMMAIQIDDMGQQQSIVDANALASENFEKEISNNNNSVIRRTRS